MRQTWVLSFVFATNNVKAPTRRTGSSDSNRVRLNTAGDTAGHRRRLQRPQETAADTAGDRRIGQPQKTAGELNKILR